eukprot:scaffold17748_cov85-Isochrysis_galbana.AAC.2
MACWRAQGPRRGGRCRGLVACDGFACEGLPCEDLPCEDLPCEGRPCEGLPCEGLTGEGHAHTLSRRTSPGSNRTGCRDFRLQWRRACGTDRHSTAVPRPAARAVDARHTRRAAARSRILRTALLRYLVLGDRPTRAVFPAHAALPASLDFSTHAALPAILDLPARFALPAILDLPARFALPASLGLPARFALPASLGLPARFACSASFPASLKLPAAHLAGHVHGHVPGLNRLHLPAIDPSLCLRCHCGLAAPHRRAGRPRPSARASFDETGGRRGPTIAAPRCRPVLRIPRRTPTTPHAPLALRLQLVELAHRDDLPRPRRGRAPQS